MTDGVRKRRGITLATTDAHCLLRKRQRFVVPSAIPHHVRQLPERRRELAGRARLSAGVNRRAQPALRLIVASLSPSLPCCLDEIVNHRRWS